MKIFNHRDVLKQINLNEGLLKRMLLDGITRTFDSDAHPVLAQLDSA